MIRINTKRQETRVMAVFSDIFPEAVNFRSPIGAENYLKIIFRFGIAKIHEFLFIHKSEPIDEY